MMTVTASRLAPGRQDVSCSVAVKLNSATRLSLSAGQPKPAKASLLAQVPGTAVSRPVVVTRPEGVGVGEATGAEAACWWRGRLR